MASSFEDFGIPDGAVVQICGECHTDRAGPVLLGGHPDGGQRVFRRRFSAGRRVRLRLFPAPRPSQGANRRSSNANVAGETNGAIAELPVLYRRQERRGDADVTYSEDSEETDSNVSVAATAETQTTGNTDLPTGPS